MGKTIEKKDGLRNLIKQDYALVNAKYSMSLNEMKLILKMMTKINMDDNEFKFIELSVKELEDFVGSKQNYQQVRNLCKSILSKPVELPIYKDGNLIGYSYANWFDRLKYYLGEGKIIARFHEDMRPVLLNLKKRIVIYDSCYVGKFDSIYSLRIYQFLKEYQKLTKRKICVEDMYSILQVPNSLTRYSQFKQKVIKVAEKELIEKSDIFFEYEEIKDGKKVISILFRIKNNLPYLKTIAGDPVAKKTKKLQPSYLKSQKSFIEFVRKNLINQTICFSKDKNSGKTMELSVSKKGLLYDKRGIKFDFDRSNEIWNSLYKLALENKLVNLELYLNQ